MFIRGSRALWIFIICQSVSGAYVTTAVNGETTLTPVAGALAPGTTSVIWKHRDNAGVVVRVIEWDREDDSTEVPNHKFRSHASLDKHTGELTLSHLQLKHTGVYTVDINSKEQREQFILTVMESVGHPHITPECSGGGAPICHLVCEGEAPPESMIIWKNSAGETLYEGDQRARMISVTNSSTPGQFYTCTLKNAVSSQTSHPVYEADLFADSNQGIIISVVILSVSVVVFVLFLIIHQVNASCAPFSDRNKSSRIRQK